MKGKYGPRSGSVRVGVVVLLAMAFAAGGVTLTPAGRSVPGGQQTAASSGVAPSLTPTVSLSPGSGPPYTGVTLTASGLTPSATYYLYFDSVQEQQSGSSVTTFSVDAGGFYFGTFFLPNLEPGGYYADIYTTDGDGGYVTSVTTPTSGEFVVTTPSVSVTTDSGAWWAPITVSVSGLAPSTSYYVELDATQGDSQSAVGVLSGFSTDSSGSYMGTAYVPDAVAAGTYYADVFEWSSWNYITSATPDQFTVDPSVSVNLPAGPSNTQLYLNATGLSLGTTYELYFDTTQGTEAMSPEGGLVETFTTPNSGDEWDWSINVPGETGGTYYLDVFDTSGAFVMAATGPALAAQFPELFDQFTVTDASLLDLQYGSGWFPGAQPYFSVEGLAPDTTYDVYLDTTQGVESMDNLQSCTTDSSGTIESCMVTLPSDLVPGTTYYLDLFQDPNPLPYIFSVASFVAVSRPPPLYAVTFSQGDLPWGTPWSVTFNGVTENSTTYSITFGVQNGDYSYAIGTVSGYTAVPSSGTVAVDYSAVLVTIDFTSLGGRAGSASEFPVTFTESGLPEGVTWYVNLSDGQLLNANGSSTSTTLMNGTYSYTVEALDGAWSASGGTFVVAGASRTELVKFNPASYNVDYAESGIPSTLLAKDGWTVVLAGTVERSYTSTVNFTVAAGTYPLLISGPPGYSSAASGTQSIVGAATVGVAFEKGSTLKLTYSEKGLPSGQRWAVELDGYTETSTRATLVFSDLSRGVYTYAVVESLVGQSISAAVGSVALSSTGNLTLAANTKVQLTFTYPYAVTFTDQGLTSGSWSVTVGRATETASAEEAIVFELGNGTYTYRVAGVGEYKVVGGTPGKVRVDGGPVAVTLKEKTESDSPSILA